MDLVVLVQYRERADSGDVYRVGVNQKIYIVTTRRLYSNTPDTDDLYYKVIFQGNNSTNYLMNGYGYYYVKVST